MKKQILSVVLLSLLSGFIALPPQAQSSNSANSVAQLNASVSSLDKAKKLNIQVSYFIGSDLIGNLDKDPTLSDGITFWELAEISTSTEGKSLTKLKDIAAAEKIADQAIVLSRQALSENAGDKESIRQLIIAFPAPMRYKLEAQTLALHYPIRTSSDRELLYQSQK